MDARRDLVVDLAEQVRADALDAKARPAQLSGTGRAAPELVADIEVAGRTPGRRRHPDHRRPPRRAGRAPLAKTHLDRQLASTTTAAMAEWRPYSPRSLRWSSPTTSSPHHGGFDCRGWLSSASTSRRWCGRSPARGRCPTAMPRPRCGGACPDTSPAVRRNRRHRPPPRHPMAAQLRRPPRQSRSRDAEQPVVARHGHHHRARTPARLAPRPATRRNRDARQRRQHRPLPSGYGGSRCSPTPTCRTRTATTPPTNPRPT